MPWIRLSWHFQIKIIGVFKNKIVTLAESTKPPAWSCDLKLRFVLINIYQKVDQSCFQLVIIYQPESSSWLFWQNRTSVWANLAARYNFSQVHRTTSRSSCQFRIPKELFNSIEWSLWAGAEYGISSKKQIFPLLLFPTLDNIGSDRRR